MKEQRSASFPPLCLPEPSEAPDQRHRSDHPGLGASRLVSPLTPVAVRSPRPCCVCPSNLVVSAVLIALTPTNAAHLGNSCGRRSRI